MRTNATSQNGPASGRVSRLFVLRAVFLLIGVIFIGRLFYVQILKGQHYKDLARGEQFKQLVIEPERGTIYLLNGSSEPVVLALNESRYTIFADPVFVKDPYATAQKLSTILNLPVSDIEEKLRKDLRYVILAKKVSKDTKKLVEDSKLKGIAWREERIRTYPGGQRAAHVLGFVNDDGVGQYGVEGYLDTQLHGVPGSIKAVTDVEGTPLVQNKDNIVSQPIDGDDVTLTLDQSMQRIVEEELKAGVERSGAKSGSVVLMESDTGRVKAMANYPSYAPSDYTLVEDQAIFKNQSVSDPLEPGSIIKTLLVAAAIDKGVATKDSTYYESGEQIIDGIKIHNLTPLSPGTRSIFDILQYSLNTGAIYLEKQFGGGDINEQARTTWHDYLVNHYLFSTDPAIELADAEKGVIPDPLEGDGLRIQYANMAFGQGLTMTIQQFASALSSAVNGGTYYSPTVVYSDQTANGLNIHQPKVLKQQVVSATASNGIVELMKNYESARHPSANREGFVVGGKTGTAQVPGTDGKYREDVYNATFAGFLGRTKPKYVIVIRLNEGKANDNFSGFEDARPVYIGIVNGIMDTVPFTE